MLTVLQISMIFGGMPFIIYECFERPTTQKLFDRTNASTTSPQSSSTGDTNPFLADSPAALATRPPGQNVDTPNRFNVNTANWDERIPNADMSMVYLGVGCFLYSAGFWFYRQGDIYPLSHVIWHLFVVMAFLCHFMCVESLLDGAFQQMIPEPR